ncbi:MAG: antibiotic biosynthesis monooxygenase [Candidatus Eremiobacteraeota bacterium]|nr:antibiotic biosynthesis monooxygenase [Candidatus Eremiobacteraeota bacterium]
MSRTLFGFYELDASPQRGLPGELATRLGAATETPGFIDGAVFVRSDNFGVAIQARFDGDGEDGAWQKTGGIALLLQAADWRSRASDLATYRLARHVDGDTDTVRDSTFFIVQRFDVPEGRQDEFVDTICAYTEEYAQPIPGFLGGDAYASLDRKHVVFVMPWAHEAALNTLENRAGSLDAMQRHLALSERHSFASYQRVSFLRGTVGADAREPATASRRGAA